MIETGYLLVEYIEKPGVEMLSETWSQYRHDKSKRLNLFKGLSRIILSLSQTPLPRIGSWTLDSDGVLRLSNRPLTLRLHQLENGGISTNMARNSTYSSTEGYYIDLLSCHDNRIHHQPNSIIDEEDGRAQVARLAIMRALLPHFTSRELRNGPFLFRLTDLHPSNIFVDDRWNVKYIIDLEWACSLPAETLHPPYWLTGRRIDELTGEHLDDFHFTYQEFMDVFEEEEKRFAPLTNIPTHVFSYRTHLMRRALQTGSFWYFGALNSPKGMYNLFSEHIHPVFGSSPEVSPDLARIVSEYWAAGTEAVIAAKLRDKEDYEKALRLRFENAQIGEASSIEADPETCTI